MKMFEDEILWLVTKTAMVRKVALNQAPELIYSFT